jgi:hypothetical protein
MNVQNGRLNTFDIMIHVNAVILAMLFMLYWIFAWGIVNAGNTMKNWGINFGISVALEFLCVQNVKILIIYVVAVDVLKPQLIIMQRVFMHMVFLLNSTNRKDLLHAEVRVVQHFSAACRAAHLKKLEHLPAASLLRHVDDLGAPRFDPNNLHFNDSLRLVDVLRCRESRNLGMGIVVIIILLVPAFAAVTSEALSDEIFNTVIQPTVMAFIMVNQVLYRVHPLLLVLIYFVVGLVVCWKFYFIPYAKKRMISIEKRALQSHHWKASRRASKFNISTTNMMSKFLGKSRPIDCRFAVLKCF